MGVALIGGMLLARRGRFKAHGNRSWNIWNHCRIVWPLRSAGGGDKNSTAPVPVHPLQTLDADGAGLVVAGFDSGTGHVLPVVYYAVASDKILTARGSRSTPCPSSWSPPGTNDYHCSVHPPMTGRIIVRQENPPRTDGVVFPSGFLCGFCVLCRKHSRDQAFPDRNCFIEIVTDPR